MLILTVYNNYFETLECFELPHFLQPCIIDDPLWTDQQALRCFLSGDQPFQDDKSFTCSGLNPKHQTYTC